MALFDISEISSQDGIKKKIEESSMGIALDILQRGIYSFPIESTVRELTSNGYDAIIERETAKSIIKGEANVEDFFDVSKDDEGVHKDSKFDRDYFDLNWLSNDDTVYIYYEEGQLRDTIRFVDHGVGLGKDRLRGYFFLNYSSKRANKKVLGRWGLGSKVAFSLGVDSFRVISRYNGRLYKFDVYLDKVESIVPKFNKDGTENKMQEIMPAQYDVDDEGNRVMVQPAYNAYYLETTQMNGLEIIVEVKKHNKLKFFEAMESQLMYLNNVKILKLELGSISHIEEDIRPTILYKDDDIVISDSKTYSKPHILLGTGDALINYGYVQFRELELEDKFGPAGLIMDINELDLTPSREAPIWSTKTREAVLKKYNKVVNTVTNYVQKQLTSATNYIEWVSMAALVNTQLKTSDSRDLDNFDTSSAEYLLAVFSKITDITDIPLEYAPNPAFKYKSEVKDMFPEGIIFRKISFDADKNKITRTKFVETRNFGGKKIYITKKQAGIFKDRYLFDTVGEFILITFDQLLLAQYESGLVRGKKRDILDLIFEDTSVLDYEKISVPDNMMQLYVNGAGLTSDDDDKMDEEEAKSYIDPVLQRKLNQEILVHRWRSYSETFTQDEVKIIDLIQYKPSSLKLYIPYSDRDIAKTIVKFKSRVDLINVLKHFYPELISSLEPVNSKGEPIKLPIEILLVSREYHKYIVNVPKFMNLTDLLITPSSRTSLNFTPFGKFIIMYNVMYETQYNNLGLYSDILHTTLPYGSNMDGIIADITVKYADAIDKSIVPLFGDKNVRAHSAVFSGFAYGNFLSSAVMDYITYMLVHRANFGEEDEQGAEYKSIVRNLNAFIPESILESKDYIVSFDLFDYELWGHINEFIEFVLPIYTSFNNVINKYVYDEEQLHLIGRAIEVGLIVNRYTNNGLATVSFNPEEVLNGTTKII
jgi:hypothetical protein